MLTYRHPGESRDLVRQTERLGERMARGGWVYMMTNRPRGVIYTGVTADLPARIVQHREGKGSAFCRKYNLIRLVYAEPYEEIVAAIAREKAIKEWKRAWKIKLIEEVNPGWDDLFDRINM